MPKRREAKEEPSTEATPKQRRKEAPPQPHYELSETTLAGLGWESAQPFEGNEDDLYRYVTEPELWAGVVMGDVDARARRRLVQLHSGLHEEMHASGFVLWRTLPPIPRGFAISLRHSKSTQLPTRRFEFPAVSLKSQRLVASSHYADGWEMRSHAGPSGKPASQPGWLRSACNLIRSVSFPFIGTTMPVVDTGWCEDRFTREDAVTYALCEGAAPRARVVAAALCTDFPAERLMRAMVSAEKNAHAIYVDVICAARYGAAYRLLCDMVDAKRREQPHRPLVVVLMSVASSDVLKRYARWGFSYGGVISGAPGEPAVYINRLEALHTGLASLEKALGAEPATPNKAELTVSDVEEGGLAEEEGAGRSFASLGGSSPTSTPRRALTAAAAQGANSAPPKRSDKRTSSRAR